VEDAQLSQVVGLVDDRGDGGADVRGRWQDVRPRGGALGLWDPEQTSLYINAG
jgi:hypothetical protein